MVAENGSNCNDHMERFIAMQPDRPVQWAYDQGVILKGIEGIGMQLADKKYFDYIQKSMDHFVQEDGSIRRL